MMRYAMIVDNVLKQKILYLPFMKFLGNLFFGSKNLHFNIDNTSTKWPLQAATSELGWTQNPAELKVEDSLKERDREERERERERGERNEQRLIRRGQHVCRRSVNWIEEGESVFPYL